MTAPRIAVVALILIAVVFFTGLGLGFRDEGSRPISMGWVEALGGMMTPRLDLQGLQGACVDRTASTALVVDSHSKCVVTLPNASRGTRRLTMTLANGNSVQAIYTASAQHENIDPNDEAANQNVSLEPKKSIGIAILKEGGSLELTCDASEKERCRVEVR